MQCYLGLGRTKVQPAEEHERKSVGTESTFRDMSDKTELREKLRWTAEELEKDLARTKFKGRTLVLKIKLHSYEVFTRQVIPPKAVSTADDLYKYSLPMLEKLEKEIPSFKLRLMGLRCTHLVSTEKPGMDFFGMRLTSSASEGSHSSRTKVDDDGEWEVWPEEEFEEAARQERQDDMNELERLSQEQQALDDTRTLNPLTQEEHLEESNRRHKHGREILPNPTPKKPTTANTRELGPSVGFQKPATGYVSPSKAEEKPWTCPICARPQSASEKDFNDHIDFCLSRQTIKEAVRDHSASPPAPEKAVEAESGKENGAVRGRGRPKGKRKGEVVGAERGNKRLFFGVQGG